MESPRGFSQLLRIAKQLILPYMIQHGFPLFFFLTICFTTVFLSRARRARRSWICSLNSWARMPSLESTGSCDTKSLCNWASVSVSGSAGHNVILLCFKQAYLLFKLQCGELLTFLRSIVEPFLKREAESTYSLFLFESSQPQVRYLAKRKVFDTVEDFKLYLDLTYVMS